jgi:type III restriction enzyme
MVGLRPYKAKSRILPEQTLGRGLRPMFRGQGVIEKVSVVGTDAFMDFVESIRNEGVDFEYAEMGERSTPKSPMVVEVDRQNEAKDIERLDIELPVLAPRLYREYKDLAELDVNALPAPGLPLRSFSEREQREIVFKDLDTQAVSHSTILDTAFTPSHQSAVGFFARTMMRDLHLVGGFEVLFGKLKSFMETRLFDRPVDIDDLNVLRNLSEIAATRAVLETFKGAINALTVRDKGTTEVRDTIKLSRTRPFLVNCQPFMVPRQSLFNRVVGNAFELEVAAFLDTCEIVSFVRNSQSTHFRIEYRTSEGSIANYYPDFIVKERDTDIWVIETKGREDIEDPRKWERLCQWCADASASGGQPHFRPLFVRQEKWEQYRPKTFRELCEAFAVEPAPGTT